MPVRIVESAEVDPTAKIGDGSSIWHLVQIRDGVTLGKNCIVGRGAYIGSGVSVGDNCKIQNYALVYEPAKLGNGVFIGPAAVLTNDEFPRAVNPDGSLKSGSDWHAVGVEIGDGASTGARGERRRGHRARCHDRRSRPGVRRLAAGGTGRVARGDRSQCRCRAHAGRRQLERRAVRAIGRSAARVCRVARRRRTRQSRRASATYHRCRASRGAGTSRPLEQMYSPLKTPTRMLAPILTSASPYRHAGDIRLNEKFSNR